MSSRRVDDYVVALLPLALVLTLMAADRIAILEAGMIAVALGAAGAAINLAVLRRSRLRPLQRYLTFIAVTISAIFAWSALVPFALR